MTGIDQSQYLKNVEDDQNVNTIVDIMLTVKNTIGKKYFWSKMLNNFFHFGKYNQSTGRIELSNVEQGIATLATDVATHTLTCPANRRYHVKFCSSVEGGFATRAYSLAAVQSGTTVNYLAAGGVMAVGIAQVLIGTPFCINNAGAFNPAIPNPITLNPGDTLGITMDGLIAGDGHHTYWVYDVERI